MVTDDSTSDNKPDSPTPPPPAEGLTFTEHLEELRLRLVYSVLFLILGCVVSFIFTRSYIYPFILTPWENISDASLQALGPTEKFMSYFKVGFVAGFVIALPFIFYQIWLFLRPGLTRKERKWVRGVFVAAFFMFLAGCAFCFYLILPVALRFLLAFEPGKGMPTEIVTQVTLDKYFSFALLLTLAGGAVFQIPLVTFFLSLFGIVSPQQLTRFRRYAILASVILAAALTPTGDPLTLSMLGVPIYLLYEISIFISRAVYKKKPETKPVTKDE